MKSRYYSLEVNDRLTIEEATDTVGEPISTGVWFLTKCSPSHIYYPRHVTGFSYLCPFLVPFIIHGYFRGSKQRIDTETMFEHADAIYCTRTKHDLVFIAGDTVAGVAELTSVLRRFPSTSLVSCKFNHSHKTPVEFVFDGGESFTLKFEGVWSDLAEFINPRSGLAIPSDSTR